MRILELVARGQGGAAGRQAGLLRRAFEQCRGKAQHHRAARPVLVPAVRLPGGNDIHIAARVDKTLRAAQALHRLARMHADAQVRQGLEFDHTAWRLHQVHLQAGAAGYHGQS